MKVKIPSIVSLLAVAGLLTNCSDNKSPHSGHQMSADSAAPAHTGNGMNHPATPVSDSTGKNSSQMALMMRSMEKMKALPMSGDPDRDFAAMMIEHHQGAVGMSQELLKAGTDTTIRRMAGQIIRDQQKEMGLFNDFLEKSPAKELGDGKASAQLMASMGSMETMHSLPLSGKPDADYVSFMMLHHQGAVEMARVEVAQGKDKDLKSLARTIIREQAKEIAAFQQWVAAHP